MIWWLRSRAATVTVGLRLLRGVGFWRSLTTALSAALSTTLFLCAVVGPGVFAAQAKRADSSKPVTAMFAPLPNNSTNRSDTMIPINELDANSTLVYRSDEIFWTEQRARLLWLAGSGPVPPGINRLPELGEAWVSPALHDLIKRSPAVRKYVGAQQIHLIHQDGLVNPQQQLAYIGAATADVEGWVQKALQNPDYDRADALDSMRIVSWGISGWIYVQDGQVLRRPSNYSTEPVIILGALFTIVIPVLALLGATSRLSSGVRERRLAALRLLGITKRRTNVIAGVESAATALVGVALGIGGFEYLRRATAGMVIAKQSWFAEDVAPSITQLAAVALGVPLVALVVTLLPLYRINRNPLSTKRLARAKSPSIWRLVPLFVGVVGLLAASRAQLFDAVGLPVEDFESLEPRWVGVVGVSALLSAVGVPVGVPVLVRLLSKFVAHRSDRAFWLLAGRSGQFDPSGASRVISTLVMVVLFSSIANTAMAIEKQSPQYQAAIKQEFTGPALVTLSANDTSAPINYRQQLLELPGMRDVVSVQNLWNNACSPNVQRSCFSVLIASCQTLKSMDLLVSDCVQGERYQLQRPRGADAVFDFSNLPPRLEIVTSTRIKCADKKAPECVDNGGFKEVYHDVDLGPMPTKTLTISNFLNVAGAFLLTELPPSMEPYRSAQYTQWFFVTDPGQAAIAGVSLAARQLDPELMVMSNGRSTLEEMGLLESLVWGLVALVGGIGVLALLVTFVDRTIERRRLTTLQRVTGVSAVNLRMLQLTQLFLPMLFAFPVAAGIGIAIARSADSIMHARETAIDWTSMLSTLFVGVLAAALVSFLSLTVMATRIRPASLRRE